MKSTTLALVLLVSLLLPLVGCGDRAPEGPIDTVIAVIENLDIPEPQVMIEARIVEASTEFSRNIGLQWQIEAGIQGDSPRAGIGPQRGFDRFEGTHGFKPDINFPFQGDPPPPPAAPLFKTLISENFWDFFKKNGMNIVRFT